MRTLDLMLMVAMGNARSAKYMSKQQIARRGLRLGFGRKSGLPAWRDEAGLAMALLGLLGLGIS